MRSFKYLGRGHIASHCLNQRTMILREDRGYKSEEEANKESKQPLKDDNEDVEYPVTWELLVTRRTLSAHMKEEDNGVMQHDNIFHTRCHIEDKVCNVVIDGGSCMNVASTKLVEKLSLPTTKHPRP